jgi:adenylate cyclase
MPHTARVFKRKVIAFMRWDEFSIDQHWLAHRLVTPQLMRRAVRQPVWRGFAALPVGHGLALTAGRTGLRNRLNHCRTLGRCQISQEPEAQMTPFTEVPLLVAFTSFTRFAAQAARLEDVQVARVMSDYYELAGTAVTAAGGRIVKFIGDATLVVFPAEAVDGGVLALLDLKDTSDRFMAAQDWECRLIVRVHFGPVIAGQFGASSDKRYDVLGKTVNTTARLESTGVALSVETFRQLGAETRRRFKKHTPPITYIRQEDSHRVARSSRRS